MRISPEVMQSSKVNNTLMQGGDGFLEFGLFKLLLMLSIDAILQKVRLQATSNLMWGIKCDIRPYRQFLWQISVTRVIKTSQAWSKMQLRERIPDGLSQSRKYTWR